MKRASTGVLAAIIIVVWAGLAWAEKSPIALKHTLTGYSKGADKVTLEYAVQVENQGNTSLNDVSLSLIPSLPQIMTRVVVPLKTLGPKEKTEISIKLYSRHLGDRKEFERKPLRWAGKYADANGTVVEFPVKSKPGGAK